MIISNYRLQDIKYLIFHKIWLIIKGKFQKNLIKVFYVKWSNNFGDLLTPIILKYYGFTPIFAYPQKAQAIIVGTIIEILDSDFSGYILGSGWTRDQNKEYKHAKILGLRGYLSKQNLNVHENITIGDPGLLISNIFNFPKSTKFILGIIPHESEINDYRILKIKQKLGNDCTIISPRDKNPINVLMKINACKYIVSSSLHGLIVSDSYEIPNGRIKINEIDNSDSYKFKDYYSSINEQLNTYQITGAETLEDLINLCRFPPKNKIDIMKKRLNDMFINFKSDFLK